jgi:hypothetical protein
MERGPLDLSQFENVRTRMQRYADAKCFNAWVVSLSRQALVVEVRTLKGLCTGDTFFVEVSGFEVSAAFQADLKDIDGAYLHFQLLTPIHVRPPYENARVRLDLDGLARADDRTVKVRVEDASAQGVGLLSEEPLGCNQPVAITIKTPHGAVNMDGVVLYCRRVKIGNWSYRSGLAAQKMKESLPLFRRRDPLSRAA